MSATPIISTIVGALVLASAGGFVVTQEIYDTGTQAAHVTNMTSDLKLCQADLIYESGFTRGRFTQAAATETATNCKVTPGTVLTVQVSQDGRNFTLVASSEAAPYYNVAMDSTAGGGAEIVEKTA